MSHSIPTIVILLKATRCCRSLPLAERLLMFSLTDINTMANKKSIASRMYNHVVNLLETPFFLDGSNHEVGDELLLKDNANQDGFKFACDPDNELFGKTFDGSPENI